MNKRYLILAIIAVAIGAGILLLPENPRDRELSPADLLNAIDDPSRFLSTDLITDRLVKKDPSLLLIDVRPEAQFKMFAIPGAINIPLDSLLTPSSQAALENKELDKVFYSNSDVMADQAWISAKRAGFEAIFVMKGGVNTWFNTIVNAAEPSETEPSQAFALYHFRKGACQYFFGTGETAAPVTEAPKKPVSLTPRPVQSSSGGGC